MKIKKLFATFAGLNEAKLELKPGLNIIEGENESGKSTWCAFLRAMLYGIPTRERDTKERRAEKNLYRPWSGALMSGRMELETDGKEITVERSGTDASPLKNFRAYTESGSDAGFTAENFGERMTGASREVFERSAFVSTPPLPSGSAELEARILETVSAGDEGASYTAAESKLREWQRALRYNRRGEIPTLEADIERLRRGAEDCREVEARIASAESELRALNDKSAMLERELKAHESSEQARAAQELSAAKKHLAEAASEREALEAKLPLDAPTLEELRSLEREYAVETASVSARNQDAERQLKTVERQIFAAVNRAQKAYGALPNAESFPKRAELAARETVETAEVLKKQSLNKKWAGLFAAVAMVLAITGFVNLFDPSASTGFAVILFIIAAGFVVAAVLVSRRIVHASVELNRLLEKWEVSNIEEIRAFAEEAAALERRYNELTQLASPEIRETPAADRLAEIFGKGTDFSDALRKTIDTAERIEQAKATERAAGNTVAALENAGLKAENGIDYGEPTMPRGEAEFQLADCRRRIADLRRLSAVAEGSLGGRDAALIDAERERLEERLRRCEDRFTAIDAALKALAQANDAMRARFSPSLNAETARILGELTGGKYTRVAVSREFKPEAGQELSILRSPDELSRGTMDQLWFALRLAVAHVTLPADAPLVLDDAFTAFDDNRLRAALELLGREAETRQILLFTCHSREANMCKDKANVNIIHI